MAGKRRIAPTLEALSRAEWNFAGIAPDGCVGGEYARAESAAWNAATAELRALLAVVTAAEKVHARYLRQWMRHQNRVEDALGKALARLARASGTKETKP